MTNINKSNLLALKGSLITTEFSSSEIEQRLNLYQVFVKLYEEHKSLLDEILQLEELSQASFLGFKPLYLQGIVNESSISIMTNLCGNGTETFLQPQHIWTIGRSSTNALAISSKHLSRNHAAIQYIENEGFYLIDYDSTNGTYVNGEPVYQSVKLNDGSQIRLGSLTFTFFLNCATYTLPEVAVESLIDPLDDTINAFKEVEFIQDQMYAPGNFDSHLIKYQQSNILDTFLNR